MSAPSSEERAAVRGPASARVFTRWTTDDLEIAEALTNGGQLQRAADLCWALLGDGRVRAALETRIKGLLRLPLSWEEAGDGRSSGRVVNALKGGDFQAAHSEAALFAVGAWGILLGVGLAQKVWRLHRNRWLGVWKPYDLRNLRWDTQRRRWMVRTETGEVEIVPGDRRWALYAPYCSGEPDGDERPWMYGAWRAVARPWLGKHFAWGDFQHHGEVHGSPIRTADYDLGPGSGVTQAPVQRVRDGLADDLGNIGADTAFIPPPGFKLKLLEAVAKTWEMFPASIKTAAVEVVVAITGQASSTELQEGQQTGATLHGAVRQDLIDADGQTFTTCIHDQSLADYTEINFGTAELAPYPRYQTAPPLNVAAKGDAMKKLGDGIRSLDAVAPEGKRVDRAKMFEEAGVDLEDVPPEVLAAQKAAAEAAAQNPPPNAPADDGSQPPDAP